VQEIMLAEKTLNAVQKLWMQDHHVQKQRMQI
jgi:hypothetical protein